MLQDAEGISIHNPPCESSKPPGIMGTGSEMAESASVVHKNDLFQGRRKAITVILFDLRCNVVFP